jgi:hypothetical protein
MGLYEILDNWFNGVYFREIPSLITSLVWKTATPPIIVENQSSQLWSKWIDGNFHVITLWSDHASIRFTSFEYCIFTILFSFLLCFTVILLGVCLIDYGRPPPPSEPSAKMSLSPSYLSGLNDLGKKEESDSDSDSDSDYVPNDDDSADNSADDSADDSADTGDYDCIDIDVYNFINYIDGYYCEMSDVVD